MRELSQTIKNKIFERNNHISNLKWENAEYFELKIKFKTPRAWDSRIFLDSILTHQVFLYVLWEDAFNLSFDYDKPVNLRVPLVKNQYEDYFFHKWSCISKIPQTKSYKTKRFLKSLPQSISKKRINTQVWETKSYMIDVWYDPQTEYRLLWMWDISEIKRILPENLYIWKSTSIWYWQAEREIKTKEKKINDIPWIIEDKKLIRPMPTKRVDSHFEIDWDFAMEKLPIAPPYFWKNAKYFYCYTEGTKINFKNKKNK